MQLTCDQPSQNLWGPKTKMLIIMKITAILLLTACLQVSAKTYSQITLREINAPLQKVFKDIQRQSGYNFLCSLETLEEAGNVTIDLTDVSLQEALNACLRDKLLTYSIVEKTVVIKPDTTKIFREVFPQPPITVHGKVVNQKGDPVAGATVTVKGTDSWASTDENGDFTLEDVNSNAVLVITATNIETVTIAIHGRNNFRIVAKAKVSPLDEVQIIAYGTESRRFSVGSVATVTADEIEKQPVTNPLLALEGRVPGLSVVAMNGVPGSTTLVQVRGQNDLATSENLHFKPYDQPYFIVDGVPFASQNANVSQLANLALAQSFSGGLSQSTGIGAFNDINPNDIESITVLKDADATAIYGTKGANGVVLITTKKGKPGKTTFDLNVNSQVNEVARPIQLLNTQQYLQLRKEAFAQDGITPNDNPNDYSGGYAPDLTIYDQNKYTNWPKVIEGNSTHNTDVHASIYGGSSNNTFLVSGGYTRSNYNYPGDFADERYTLHTAVTSTSTNKRLNLALVTDYSYDQNNSAGFGGMQDILLPPNAPDEIDQDGNLIWDYKNVPIYTNFYATLRQPSNLQTFNFNSSLNLKYAILKDLKIGVSMGYSRNTGTEHSIDPLSSQRPSSYGNTISAAFGNTAAQDLNIEPQINYQKRFGRSVFTALLGGTYEKNTTYAYQTQAYGYSNDAFLNSINGSSSQSPFEQSDLLKYVALFGRLKYILNQKYILEVGGRRDGSSNFGPGKQFGTFGSVGAGWIFSEEKAFKHALPFISYGKLSGSYGTTGTDASESYQFQALYTPFPYTNTTPFQGIKQNIPYNLYNPDFRWATKKSLNVAADLGFFNNRLLLNVTYYRDREGDQLVAYPLAAQAGFATVFENQNATVENKGWEFVLTSTNIKRRNFSWTTSFNITFNRNKLLSFPNLEASSYAQQYVIGQPTSVIFGYRYKGVNPTTGQFEFYDKDGKATSNPQYGTAETGGDQVVIGNRETNYMGGLGNIFSYKHFSLYVFCQFSSSTQPNAISALYSNYPPGEAYNIPTYVLGKYWTGPGDTHATLQRLGSSYSSPYLNSVYDFVQSSGAYTNDTYLRVKTAALSYALPDTWIQKLNIKNASIFVNAQNLFTITNYKFGDPEQPGSFTSFPLQRIIAFGFNLKF